MKTTARFKVVRKVSSPFSVRPGGNSAFTIAELLVGVIIVAICAGVLMLALASGNKHDKP